MVYFKKKLAIPYSKNAYGILNKSFCFVLIARVNINGNHSIDDKAGRELIECIILQTSFTDLVSGTGCA